MADVTGAPGAIGGGNLHAFPVDPMERLDAARKLESAGALGEADDLFRSIVDQVPRECAAARALLRRAHIHRAWGTWQDAIRLAQAGRGLARQLGEVDLEAELLNAEGAVHQARGALDEAEAMFTGMLGIALDVRIRGVALQNLGANAAMRRDFDEAARRFAGSEECFRRAGYRRGEAFALNNRGRALLDQGETLDEAMAVFVQASGLAAEVGDLDLRALATMNLAETHLKHGDREAARHHLSHSCAYYNSTQNPWRVIDCLKLEGDIALAGENPELARRVWAEGLDLAVTLGAQNEIVELRTRLRRLEKSPNSVP
jgi:tetratricopeptide (TPR) repeat protein